MTIKSTKQAAPTRKPSAVGQTIGERRANPLENQPPAAPQAKAQIAASTFGQQTPKNKNLAQFAPKVTYNSAVMHFRDSAPHKRAQHHLVESGMKAQVTAPPKELTDDKRLAFLDKVIDFYSPKQNLQNSLKQNLQKKA